MKPTTIASLLPITLLMFGPAVSPCVANAGTLIAAANDGTGHDAHQAPAAKPPDAQPPDTKPAPDQQPASKERVAAIKKSLAESQARLRHYQWIETTAVSLKGDEKANTQKRCYYGADGKVQKISLEPPADDKPSRGIRGKIKEKKKAELTGYLKNAADLVHEYVPPDPEKIQKALESGKATIRMIEPGKRAALEFADYQKPGDSMSIEIDLANNAILAVAVTSWLEDAKDIIKLNITFDKLADGTIYTSETVLQGEAQKVKVDVTNTGYRQASS